MSQDWYDPQHPCVDATDLKEPRTMSPTKELTKHQNADLNALYARCYERGHVPKQRSVCGECLEAYLRTSEVNGRAAYRQVVEALRGIAELGCCETPGCSVENPLCTAITAKQALAAATEERR